MHVHREGSLDVALNNCIGAREGRRKVRARRHDEPIISPDVSARSPFNRPRPIEPASFRAPPHVLCFPTMLLSSCNPYIRACGSRVFKGCSLWTILCRNVALFYWKIWLWMKNLFFLWFNLITKLYLKNNTNILNSFARRDILLIKKLLRVHKHRGLDREN